MGTRKRRRQEGKTSSFLFARSHPRWGQRRIDCRVICNNKGGSPDVWTSNSRLADTRGRFDDLFLRDTADTAVYAMKLSDGNRAFSLPRDQITSSKEE